MAHSYIACEPPTILKDIMYIKDINKLKRKMNKVCAKAVNEIIEQLIANENEEMVRTGNSAARYEPTALEVKFIMDVNSAPPSSTNPFQIYCNPKIDLNK